MGQKEIISIMKHLILLGCLGIVFGATAQTTRDITVKVNEPVADVQPTMYGVFLRT